MGLRMLRPRLATLDLRRVRPPAKVTLSYYGSKQHKEWARAVIARANHRCEDCGAGGKLYADHQVELVDGGNPQGRGVARCAACHTTKTNIERAKRIKR
jgi:5-methylcytosine-specific restriction enzyme A